MQSRESVYPSLDHMQSGAGSQNLTSGRQLNLETDTPSVYQCVANEQPLSRMMSSGQRSNPVMWQRLYSETNLRHPVPIESLVPIGPPSRGDEETWRRQRGDSRPVRAVDTHQVLLRQGDVGHSSACPQLSFSSADSQQRQSVQRPESERGIVGAPVMSYTRRTARSDRYCSSPTIDEQALGITKADICRCHGTFEHKYSAMIQHQNIAKAIVVLHLHMYQYRSCIAGRVPRRNLALSKTSPGWLAAVIMVMMTSQIRVM